MTYGLIIRHEAEADIAQAAASYETLSYQLGARFLGAVRERVMRIVSAPEQFPCILQDLRRALVRDFPYAIYFYVDDEDVTVIACMHTKRDPRAWMDRM